MASPESPVADMDLERPLPAADASPLTVTIPTTTTVTAVATATDERNEKSLSQQPSPPPVSPVLQVQPQHHQQQHHPSKAAAPLSPTNRRVSKRIKIRRKSRPIPKIFHDAISVIIPLEVTVDLKVAMEHTRAKRIQSIFKRFPALKKAVKKWKHSQELQNDDDVLMDDDDASNSNNKSSTGNKDPNSEGKENNKPLKKKKKVLAHVPQPEQYGSVIDYLEAKYVRGVMLGDENGDGESMDDGSEGQGSVYSAGSFLDDTDLRRDVAEQVMANTTLTKLELENEDGEFFVNVGALEVEENQYDDNYDPLQDTEVSTKTTKKRKKPQQQQTTEAAALGQSMAKKSKQQDDLAQSSSKTIKSTTSTISQKKKASTLTVDTETTTPGALDGEENETEEQEELIARVKETKAKSDRKFKRLAELVEKMTTGDLPRRKAKLKVSLTCPPNKKPGDDVTFTNPHNKSQRLRVKVPKDCLPGGTFKVSVPVKPDPVEADGEEKDHNTFSREFQELLDDYARAHDDWCGAQAAVDKNFALLKEKQAKYDPLVALFPTNLLTPVTVEYMKKVVRRARQNRHKRKKNAAMKGDSSTKDDEDDDGAEDSDREDAGGNQDDGTTNNNDDDESTTEQQPQKRIVEIPTMGSKFPKIKFSEADFGN